MLQEKPAWWEILTHPTKERIRGPHGRRLPDKKKSLQGKIGLKEPVNYLIVSRIFTQLQKSDVKCRLDCSDFDKILFFRVPTLLRKGRGYKTRREENNNNLVYNMHNERVQEVRRDRYDICRICQLL